MSDAVDEHAEALKEPPPEAPAGFEFPPPIESAAARVGIDRLAAPYDFPPMGNSYVVGVASTALSDDADFLSALERFEAGAVEEVARQMASAVAQANAEFFRCTLTDVHEDDQPTALTVHRGESLPGVSELRSTRKVTLVLILRVSSESGVATIRVPLQSKEVAVEPGMLVMYPSYLDAHIDLGADEQVDVLISHAHGPSFC